MLEELRRHYSQATTQRYIRFVERFAQHFHSSPDCLGRQQIREYLAQLFTVQKLSPGTVTNRKTARGNRLPSEIHRSSRDCAGKPRMEASTSSTT
jgi:hypothetical protein